MIINKEKAPKSSFLSVSKDAELIINKLLGDNRLKKLLFYNSDDALFKPYLTEEQTVGLVGTSIQMFPKLRIDPDVKNYIFIDFDTFHPNPNNPHFTDNNIQFDIIIHADQWFLKDFEMRPYAIAGEIDSLFNNSRLTGIGVTNFVHATDYVYNDEFFGFTLTYKVVHGDEDKKGIWNPSSEEQFLEDFFEDQNEE